MESVCKTKCGSMAHQQNPNVTYSGPDIPPHAKIGKSESQSHDRTFAAGFTCKKPSIFVKNQTFHLLRKNKNQQKEDRFRASCSIPLRPSPLSTPAARPYNRIVNLPQRCYFSSPCFRSKQVTSNMTPPKAVKYSVYPPRILRGCGRVPSCQREAANRSQKRSTYSGVSTMNPRWNPSG